MDFQVLLIDVKERTGAWRFGSSPFLKRKRLQWEKPPGLKRRPSGCFHSQTRRENRTWWWSIISPETPSDARAVRTVVSVFCVSEDTLGIACDSTTGFKRQKPWTIQPTISMCHCTTTLLRAEALTCGGQQRRKRMRPPKGHSLCPCSMYLQ